jgi:hypothetical protein
MTNKIENAKITSTMLGLEDHGIMTSMITVEGPGWGCGFGGYAFDGYDPMKKRRCGVGYGIEFIKRVLSVVGVEKWEDLPGKHVRVETEGWGGRILRIGNILENKWFDPASLAEEMKASE